MMYAVLQWDYNAPFGTRPLIIVENKTYEEAELIARMNPDLYNRQIIPMSEVEYYRHG